MFLDLSLFVRQKKEKEKKTKNRPTARPESMANAHGLGRVTVHQLERWRTAYTLESGEPRHALNQWQRLRLGACDRSRLEPWRTAYTLESGEPRHALNQWQRPRLGACDGSPAGTVANPCHGLNQWQRPRLGACDRSPAGAVANRLHLGIRRTTACPESMATPTAWGV